jgi:hypothetical protein
MIAVSDDFFPFSQRRQALWLNVRCQHLAVASILSKLAVFVRSWIALKPILMKKKYLTFLAFFFSAQRYLI